MAKERPNKWLLKNIVVQQCQNQVMLERIDSSVIFKLSLHFKEFIVFSYR